MYICMSIFAYIYIYTSTAITSRARTTSQSSHSNFRASLTCTCALSRLSKSCANLILTWAGRWNFSKVSLLLNFIMRKDDSADFWECVAVCCSVLQCVAVCCSVCSVLQCVAVCCSVLQCVAVCCSVLQCVTMTKAPTFGNMCWSVLQRVTLCCNVLQCDAVCDYSDSADFRESFTSLIAEALELCYIRLYESWVICKNLNICDRWFDLIGPRKCDVIFLGPNLKSAVTCIQFLYITQLSNKRMVHNYRAFAIKLLRAVVILHVNLSGELIFYKVQN